MKTHRNIPNIASLISHTSVSTDISKSLLVLSMITLIVPVLPGCNKIMHPQDGDFTEPISKASVKLAVHNTDLARIHHIDALVFNDDPLQRLDCFQHLDTFSDKEVPLGSCSGNKKVLLCANSCRGIDQWRQCSSLAQAKDLKVNLEDENRNYPVMVSQFDIVAGNKADIIMERLSSTVELRSICCDFSGKPYKGEKITEAKVYLININATCSLMPSDDETIERVINHGGLIDQDMESFKDKNLILQSINDIGIDTAHPDCKFPCYPNTTSEETVGSPFTRLVIEGKIMGETWYWSIDINRENGNEPGGIERNRRYIFDITITSKGTKDPNICVSREMVQTLFEIKTWKEKEEYHIAF